MHNRKNYRLNGVFMLQSPLSHIGESVGVDSYLSTDVIIGEDGQPTECFVYSGNAFRGLLRDCAAAYMLERMGNMRIPLDAFYLLFSGGSLGGTQSVDIDQARMYRRVIPMLSVWGGGVGNQILPGKLRMGSLYPICKETTRIIPEKFQLQNAPSWKRMSFEKSFTRMDDGKNDNRRAYLIEGTNEHPKELQTSLDFGGEDNEGETTGKKKNPNAPAQQMRYSVEMMAAGTALYQRIDLSAVTEVELGAFVSALAKFSVTPYIGGKSGTGHGLVDVEYHWSNDGKDEPFLSLSQDDLYLSDVANEAKKAYDAQVLQSYNQYIESNQSEITIALGAEK
jgi:CRISPR type IV-associated protein Csf2